MYNKMVITLKLNIQYFQQKVEALVSTTSFFTQQVLDSEHKYWRHTYICTDYTENT